MNLQRLFPLCAAALFAVLSARANPVVFLHGWNSDASLWSTMTNQLVTDAGYAPTNILALSYYAKNNSDSSCSTDTDIADVAAFVAREIKTFQGEHGGAPIDVVCHSMGGLVVRYILAHDLIEPGWLRHYVPIATPHYGQNVETSYFLDTYSSYQTDQMKYGSRFLWDLAAAWSFEGKNRDDTLCVIGVTAWQDKFPFSGSTTQNGSYWDGLVHCWSAALADRPCRYVQRCHSSSCYYMQKGGICACDGGTDDPVYKLVKAYLADGTILAQSELGFNGTWLTALSAQGGLFYQVVRPDGTPEVFASTVDDLVSEFRNESTGAAATVKYYEHGTNDTETQGAGIELVYGTVPAATYAAAVRGTGTWAAFTNTGVAVTGGRTAVLRLRDGAAVTVVTNGTETVAVSNGWLAAEGLAVSAEDLSGCRTASTNVWANGETGWASYVAGLTPTNPASHLLALIACSNSMPSVTWTPDLGAARVYTVEGKTNLTDAAWAATNSATRFFRVRAEMK